ncbi:MAG: acetylxylan esterase [Bacteroidales bacterium]|nr:MAG: acetylxylan esterase [Bacteroidales bacterium]
MNKKANLYFNIFVLAFLSFDVHSQITYDKVKVPEYKLPELLISNNGKKIQIPEDWINIRRPEIIRLFEAYVYGGVPEVCLEIKFATIKTDLNALYGKAIKKNIVAFIINEVDTVQMELLIFIPANAKKPVPLFLGMNFYGNQSIHHDSSIPITKSYVNNNPEYNIFNHKATYESRGSDSSSWPVERILERGYGLATFCYGDLDPDFDDGFKNGIHSLLDYSEKNDSNKLSSISAWAYGLTTVMDYFETDEHINKSQIIVIGHSRLGKTALWAGAIDQRFAIIISNNSGCGGAALSRRKTGETVKDINTGFPHWFSRNFHYFNDKENELPVDQHMLIGLIAPRPVYVGSAEQDKWADPYGEFLSLYHAGPVYKLFGSDIISKDTLPEINKPLWTGKMGYHIRAGDHGIKRFDWEKYLDFADYHFNRKSK